MTSCLTRYHNASDRLWSGRAQLMPARLVITYEKSPGAGKSVRLSHFSVREFLCSGKFRHSREVSKFLLEKQTAKMRLAACCIRFWLYYQSSTPQPGAVTDADHSAADPWWVCDPLGGVKPNFRGYCAQPTFRQLEATPHTPSPFASLEVSIVQYSMSILVECKIAMDNMETTFTRELFGGVHATSVCGSLGLVFAMVLMVEFLVMVYSLISSAVYASTPPRSADPPPPWRTRFHHLPVVRRLW